MTDNIQAEEQEVHRRLVLFLRIPNETWTDVLKLFSRCILIQKISPVCHRLKEISDKNVKNIHIIEKSREFVRKLDENDPEANRELEDLAAHKCPLASQFRMVHLTIPESGLNEAMKAILRHSLDLFQGCQIKLKATYLGKASNQQLAYLTLLEPTKPAYVFFDNFSNKTNIFTLLWHPTVLNCDRFKYCGRVQDYNYPCYFDWLHYKPEMAVDLDNDDDEPEVRCLIVTPSMVLKDVKEFIHLLLARCVKNFQKSKTPSDRRHFLLYFRFYQRSNKLENFGRIENPSTGEVLLVEPVKREGRRTGSYHLLRCLAKRVVDGTEQFYGKIFSDYGYIYAEDEQGKEPAKLEISTVQIRVQRH